MVMVAQVRVLVVDDADESRAILRRALGFDPAIEVVGEANSGTEAVRQAESLRPDVVLMDVRMPGGDGVTATREITRRFPMVHVIALTAHDDQDSVRDMLTAGATGYLVKGAPVDEVTSAIRKASAGEGQIDDRVLPHVIEELRVVLGRERSRRAEAERLARTRQEFIQVLSHELRTPLTVIGGALQTLGSSELSDEVRNLLAAAIRRTHDLERMVEGLELIGQARPTSGDEANPAGVLARVVSALAERPDESEATDEIWRGVHENHLGRVTHELLMNALQHGKRPVTVRLYRDGREGIVEVTDVGGFEPDPKMFGPFVQGDMSTMREAGGLGLGLFIATRLTESGGGRLDVRRRGSSTVAEARFLLD
jgi:DNA-binding NarL/FixJ family response regulator